MAGRDDMDFDAEVIARVLDGRASAAERAQLLARADHDPDLLGLIADSAAAMNETDANAVTPIETPRPSRARWMVGAIAAALIITVGVQQLRTGSIPSNWSHLARRGVAAEAARLGPALPELRSASPSVERGEVSARLGLSMADYVMIQSDTARSMLADRVAALLRSIPTASVVANRFTPAPPASQETIDAVEAVTEQSVFRAAAWGELVRLHAIARDSAFLKNPEVQSALAAIRKNGALTSATRASAAALLEAVKSPTIAWEGLEQAASHFLSTFIAPSG